METVKGHRTIEQLKELIGNMQILSIEEEKYSRSVKNKDRAAEEHASSDYHMGVCIGILTTLSSFLAKEEMQEIRDEFDARDKAIGSAVSEKEN